MDKKEIKEGVIECLIYNDYIDSDFKIKDTTSFADDLDFDSLDKLEFALNLEYFFNIDIKDEDVWSADTNKATLADVCSYLEKILIND